MKVILFFICILFSLTVIAQDFKESNYENHLEEVRNYIDFFFNKSGKYYAKKHVGFPKETIAPLVVKHSLYRNIDPLLTSIIISFESTWKPEAIGERGETRSCTAHSGNYVSLQ